MTVFEGRKNDWGRSDFAVEIERMAPFINAPTVILPAPEQDSGFPKVLAVIANPNLPGFLVCAHPPWIAQAVGPVLRTGVFDSNERIVFRDRIRPRSIGMIHINAQHAAVQVAQV